MTAHDIIGLISPLVAGSVGVAVGYGALKQKVETNARNIGRLFSKWDHLTGEKSGIPQFIRPHECALRHGEVEHSVNDLCLAVKGLQNYARYQMTQSGMSLSEANKILSGNGR